MCARFVARINTMNLQISVSLSTLKQEALLNADVVLHGLQIFDDSITQQHHYTLPFDKHRRIGINLSQEVRTVSILLLVSRALKREERERRDVISRVELPLLALTVGRIYTVPLFDSSLLLTKGRIQRGSVSVQLTRTSVSGTLLLNAAAAIDAEYLRDMSLLHDLQLRYAHPQGRLKTTKPAMAIFDRMRVPAFAFGAAEPLPASTFFWLGLVGVRSNNAAELNFYTRQLNTALRFTHLSAQEFRATVKRTLTGDWSSSQMPAMWHTLTLTHTLFTNSMSYVGDRSIKKMASERMKIARNGQWNGDCEDTGMEASWEFTRFHRMDSDLFEEDSSLQSLHRVAQLFVPSPFTGSVTSAQAGVEETEKDLGNHIYGVMTPREYFLEILAVNESDKRVLSKSFHRVLSPVAGERANVRVLFLEGTNFSDNQPEDPCNYVQNPNDRKAITQRLKGEMAARTYLMHKYASDLKGRYSPEIKQTQSGFGAAKNVSVTEISNFYRYPIESMFDFRHVEGLSRQFSVARWVTDSDNTYGIDLRAFLDRSNDIVLEPTFYYENAQEIELLERILLRQERPMPLIVDKSTTVASMITQEEKEMAMTLLVDQILSKSDMRGEEATAAHQSTLQSLARKIKQADHGIVSTRVQQHANNNNNTNTNAVRVQFLSRLAQPNFDVSKLQSDRAIISVEQWSQNFARDAYDRVDLTVLEVMIDTTKLPKK